MVERDGYSFCCLVVWCSIVFWWNDVWNVVRGWF